jgi:hypothetical protein
MSEMSSLFAITSPTEDSLADSVAKLSVFLCTEEFTDSQASSTFVVYFSGIVGISPCGTTFERPKTYTSKLSALIYCIRLSLLEATLPRFAHASNHWSARPRTGCLKLLNKVRERYMCYGCQAPMGELISLRGYGRTISRTDGPSFRVQWSDAGETVSWDDGELSMDQFGRLGRVAFTSATASMTKLMYGLTPTIELESLRDRISNTAQGCSFVQDPANRLRGAYLDLSAAACLHISNGLISGEHWDMEAVHRYLKEEANLLIQIMLVMYLRGGQSPRVPELSSIECDNGPSTARGVYTHAGRVVYSTRHTKARRSTNQEFHVARYLPTEDSALVAKYLVYVRPFANMLWRICHSFGHERRLLLASMENPERPWKSDVLTKALKTLTHGICDVAFGVLVYRQLSVAVTERHIKQIRRPFNRYDDKSTDAAINVAFAWQSAHRPIQRGIAYGIDRAYPDSLQPALLGISVGFRRVAQVSSHRRTILGCIGGFSIKSESVK